MASSIVDDVEVVDDVDETDMISLPLYVAEIPPSGLWPFSREVIAGGSAQIGHLSADGVLAKIAAIFAGLKIGISSVIQPEGHEGESVPLIMMLHDAPNAAMRKALDKIAKLPFVKGKPVMFRVESFE